MNQGSLLQTLAGAESFEAVAEDVLRRCLDVVEAAVRLSPLRGARVLRAMLHLAPDRGFQGLYVLEVGSDRLEDPSPDQRLMPSAGAWSVMRTRGCAVEVDVATQVMRTVDGAAGQTAARRPRAEDLPMSSGTHRKLLDRDATHVYALPVRAPGRLAGMISIEAQAMGAVGQPFVWGECHGSLSEIVALAGPYLASLPSQRRGGLEGDELLPVVGPSMAPLVQAVRAFAAEEETLLIRGETGTGKSRMARWAHARSPRADGPFEVLDLLSVPEDMQMGELFGWKRGAFTGAVEALVGAVSRADGGTLFIDEIDKLSMRAQAGLLTLLEEKRYRALGDARERTADVRFVVGTNADLHAAVAAGRFREDLLYRIDVLPVALPPLRERSDEIAGWAIYMLQRRHREKGRGGRAGVSPEAVAVLRTQRWPGNLRQLDNVVRRAYTLAALDPQGGDVTIDARHLQTALGLGGVGGADTPIRALLDAFSTFVAALASEGRAVEVEGMDLGGALYGLLLAAALEATDGREEAFRLIGRGELIKNRNHHKVLRREAERAVDLARRLGEPVPAVLERILAR